MLKIKHFSHTDLDGLGAVSVMKHYFNSDVATLSHKACSYDKIDEEVTKFMKYDHAEFDLVFITDISVNAETAKLVEERYQQAKNIQLIDHHETALWLNEYDWAQVEVGSPERLESGTSLLNEYLHSTFHGSGLTSDYDYTTISEFAETVRLYDTWEWDRNGDIVPQQLNDLLGQYGRTQFIRRFANDPQIQFSGLEADLIKKVAWERDSYIQRKSLRQTYRTSVDLKTFITDTLDTSQFGERELGALTRLLGDDAPSDRLPLAITNIERYHSEVGNAIAKDTGGIVILLDFDRNTMSFRTATDFPVNQLAILFGGGGHAKAAGAPLSSTLMKSYWDRML